MTSCFFVVTFLMFVFIAGDSCHSLRWTRDENVFIRTCKSNSRAMWVKWIGNEQPIKLKSAGYNRIRWVIFTNPNSSFEHMFGVERNNTWYFMVVRDMRLELQKNCQPIGTVLSTDTRLFNRITRPENNLEVLQNIATGTYLRCNQYKNKIVITSEQENAGSFSFIYFE